MVLLATAASFACGCAVSHKTAVKPSQVPGRCRPPRRHSSLTLQSRAEAVQSLNAGVTMKLTAGSAYSGVIEQYHEVNGFILAARPANIPRDRPGPGHRHEHLRHGQRRRNVQHLHSVEEQIPRRPGQSGATRGETDRESQAATSDRCALLAADTRARASPHGRGKRGEWRGTTCLRLSAQERGCRDERRDSGSMDWEIARKIWFNRADLRVARIENFGPDGGKIASDVTYGNWQASREI